jgi:SET domain-containing protein
VPRFRFARRPAAIAAASLQVVFTRIGSMSSRRIAVRRSGVHGKGVFAVAPIKAGERVVEYKGERISWKEALRRHPHDPNEPNHTFYFALEEGGVIDGKINGNSARWINHSCAPNCEAEEIDGRVYIHALRDIEPEEELFYDYGLVIDAKLTKKLKREYACHCGADTCRGTLLATPDEDKKKKKKDKKDGKSESGSKDKKKKK